MSGPFRDREAHVGEDRDDLVRHLREGMDAARLDRRIGDRQRQVQRLAFELRFKRGGFQDFAAGAAPPSPGPLAH